MRPYLLFPLLLFGATGCQTRPDVEAPEGGFDAAEVRSVDESIRNPDRVVPAWYRSGYRVVGVAGLVGYVSAYHQLLLLALAGAYTAFSWLLLVPRREIPRHEWYIPVLILLLAPEAAALAAANLASHFIGLFNDSRQYLPSGFTAFVLHLFVALAVAYYWCVTALQPLEPADPYRRAEVVEQEPEPDQAPGWRLRVTKRLLQSLFVSLAGALGGKVGGYVGAVLAGVILGALSEWWPSLPRFQDD